MMSNLALITCRICMVSGRAFSFQLPRSCLIQEILDLHLFPAMEEQGIPLIGVFVQFTCDTHVVSRGQTLGALPGAQEGNLVELSMALQAWQFERPEDICSKCGFIQLPMLSEEQRVAEAIGHQEKGATIHLKDPPYSAASCFFCPRVTLSCQRCGATPLWKHPQGVWWVCPDCSGGRQNKDLTRHILSSLGTRTELLYNRER
jgi:hypothetical protein